MSHDSFTKLQSHVDNIKQRERRSFFNVKKISCKYYSPDAMSFFRPKNILFALDRIVFKKVSCSIERSAYFLIVVSNFTLSPQRKDYFSLYTFFSVRRKHFSPLVGNNPSFDKGKSFPR